MRLLGPAVLGLALWASACAPPPPAPSGTTTVPVVLISIDTLRADRLPAYGYTGVDTPAIDALRNDAILVHRAFSPYPLTLPAHVSILSGQAPTEHGVRDNVGYRLDTETPYLPRQLRAGGYRTAAMVSSFVLRGESGLADGFEVYDDHLGGTDDPIPGQAQRPGAATLARAARWLRDRGTEAEAPFFLFFHLYEPHTPYAPPEPFASRYDDPYDGEVAAADAVVGELLALLHTLDLYDRSLIILLADHGEGLGDHGEAEHGILLHREALEVPLLIKLPQGQRAGDVLEGPVSLVDVAPTIRALSGLPGGERSLLAPQATRSPVYAETQYPRLQLGWSGLTSLVEDRWHYIHGPAPALYDQVSDPRETENLIARERRVQHQLAARLEALSQPLALPQGISAETAAQLTALGYLAGAAATDGDPGIDPHTALPAFEALRGGARLLAEGDATSAADALQTLVEAHPEMPGAWEALALALARLGRDEAAARAFARARQAGGGHGSTVTAAQVLVRLNRLDEARALAEAGIEADPVGAHSLLAELALAADKLYVAQRHIEEAQAARPDNAATQLLSARLALRRGNLEKAQEMIDSIESSLRQQPTLRRPARLDHVAAEVAAGLGDHAAAEAAFRAAIETDPADLQAYTRLTRLLVLGGRDDDAIAALNAMLVANPTAEAYAEALTTLEELHNPSQAERLRAHAQRLFPDEERFR